VRYLGIDFSGAKDAGRRIWISEGVELDGSIIVEALLPARELKSSGRDRTTALSALVDHIASLGRSIVGIDAPNSLPKSFAPEGWAPWFDGFAAHGSAEAFREACRRTTGGRETKRCCDELARTPFAAWNLRLYRQTWHSLTDLYAPLLQRQAVTVAPFQRADSRPRLAEICPASTLKHLELYKPYKGRKLADERQALLREMTQRAGLRMARGLQERAVEDVGGDALDAVIALAAAARCRKQIERHEPASEGEVYVWDGPT
jgi:hypothetical protein